MTEFQPDAASHMPQAPSQIPAQADAPLAQPTPAPSQWMQPAHQANEPTLLVAPVPGQGGGQTPSAPYASINYPPPGVAAQAPYAPSTYAQPTHAPAPPASAPLAYGTGPAWAPAYAPAKRRKVWPWVVGGVGLLAVLAGAAIGGIVWLGSVATNGANPDYSAAPIGNDDEAGPGSTMFVGASGKYALEVPDEWVNVTADVAPLMTDTDVDGFENVGFEAWTDGDPNAGLVTTLIMVLDTEGPVVMEGGVPEFHDGFVTAAAGTLVAPEFSIQPGVTTSHGLEVSHSHGDALINGTPATIDVHTAGRGNHMVTITVIDYIGTGVNFPDVVDTLRIDK